ncbi:MAG: FimV/HubP family polar landmark protein [Burkholderiaceae bacterium]
MSGEPLRAEIELDDSPNGDASNGNPSVATPGTYRDLGLVYPEALTDARVVRERRTDGRWVARVFGTRPVTDRGMMLVMSLNSPSGQHVRTYRVDLGAPRTGTAPRVEAPVAAPTAPAVSMPSTLLAPPAAPAAPAEPVRVQTVPPATEPIRESMPAPARAMTPAEQARAWLDAGGRRAEPQRMADPVPESTRPASRPTAAAPAPRAAGETVTVVPGETATTIARRYKPADVTDAQAVMALYRANASAFSGSANRLPAGAVLTVPDVERMREQPPAQALAELRAQAPVSPGADRLRLSGGGKGKGTGPEGGGGDGDVNKSIAYQAAMSEAKSRISQLETIVGGLKKLTDTRDKQLAGLSAELASLGRPVSPPAPVAAPVPSAPVPPAAASGSVADSPVVPVGAATATMLSAPSRSSGLAPQPAPVPEDDVQSMLTDPRVIGAGVAAILLLGLVVVWMRRRRQTAEAEDDDPLSTGSFWADSR